MNLLPLSAGHGGATSPGVQTLAQDPTSGSGGTSGTSGSSTGKPAVSSDFETFLRMMTVQMQNQDPLNPIDSADYAVQLATFSGVEQQVRTNDLLTTLGQQIGAMGLAQVAGWVGMEARVAAPAQFDGTPITIYPTTDPTADAATLVVTDASGTVVGRQPIDPSSGALVWAGTDGNGQPLPSGQYTFTVTSMKNGQPIGSDQAQVYALVQEARFVDGKLSVILQGGSEVPASGVSALRVPGG